MFSSKKSRISSSVKRRADSAPPTALLALIALVLSVLGCGSTSTGAVGSTPLREREAPIELALRIPNGAFIHLGDLRDTPTLLFVFATFDGVSQAALRPTSRFARLNGDEVHVIGVLAQPNAGTFAEIFASALHPPFSITYDPDERIEQGTSSLGQIEAVPLFIMIDAEGYVRGKHVGFPNAHTLDRLLETARRPR